MKYKATLSSRHRMSLIIVLLFIVSLNFLPVFIWIKHYKIPVLYEAGVLIPDIAFLILFLRAPRHYVVHEKGVEIRSFISRKYFPYENIDRVELIRKSELGRSIRRFGPGYFFGYYGTFRSGRYGEMKWYINNRKNLIMIYTKDDKRILVSPDNRNMFDEICIFHKGKSV